MLDCKTKICKKCKTVLDTNMFYKHKQCKDGFLNICKTCKKKESNERQNKLRLNNPDWVLKEKNRLKEIYHKLNSRWEIINGFSGYSISETGLIKNNTTNRILKSHVNNYGYLTQNLIDNSGVQKKIYIHRLLAETFIIKKSDELTQVDHIDRNPLNNNLENLRWVTPLENINNRGIVNKTGVYFDDFKNKWCVTVKEKNELKHFLDFDNLDKAVRFLKEKITK